MKGKAILIIIGVILCVTCRNTSKKSEGFVFPKTDSVPVSEAEKLSPEAIADSQTYLASKINADKQGTNFEKALNLGILGADLGYLNMYEKTSSSLDVLSSIRKLAEDIKVGQFFDFELIKRLSQNKSNLDSLLFISMDSYNQIDNYFRANDRGQFAALMIIGVWIEGQYLATQVASQFSDKMLNDRIGEQKIILNDLLLLVSPYCNLDQEFKDLCTDLQKIKETYRPVRITYTQGNPVSEEKDGGLVVKQTETSVVEMTTEQLAGIIEISKNIRNRLISNN
jgi:hypothetical protein